MSAITGIEASRRRLRRLAWAHPEWWVIVLCGAAWIAMLQPHAHHMHHAQRNAVMLRLSMWLLMALAMMLPLVLGPVRFAAQRSLWRRRHRAIVGFLTGYVGCWLIAGIAVALVTPGYRTAALPFAAAGAWQLTRRKRFALVACHRVIPLAPRGWRADRDCIRYGWSIAVQCVASCWVAMAACALTGHSVLLMSGLFGMSYAERYTRRPDHRLLSATFFAAAIVTSLYPY